MKSFLLHHPADPTPLEAGPRTPGSHRRKPQGDTAPAPVSNARVSVVSPWACLPGAHCERNPQVPASGSPRDLLPQAAENEGHRDLPLPTTAPDSTHLRVLGPVEGAGAVAWVPAVDLAAVHVDDHFSTPGERGARVVRTAGRSPEPGKVTAEGLTPG